MIFGLFGRKKEKQAEEVLIGSVIHFFPHVKVAVIKVDQGRISVGNVIRIKGHTSDFRQKIKSMEIEHETMDSVSKGQEVAIKVKKRARIGDQVFMPRE